MAREIPVGADYAALVDDEDYERLSAYIWHPLVSGRHVYAHRRAESRSLTMQRDVLGCGDLPHYLHVDHINGDRLDNRRSNLRICTPSQNHANQGPRGNRKYKGTTYLARTGRYGAQIKVNYERKHLGYFATEEEAARAYDQAAFKAWGEYARLNFPQELPA